MFPKTGSKFGTTRCSTEQYAHYIATALRDELGDSHRATKTLMRWTGASDRTAKNWLCGSHGPSGEHLILLARESDVVFATILRLAGRDYQMIGAEISTIRNALKGALSLIDETLA